jgi:hypothetical protein
MRVNVRTYLAATWRFYSEHYTAATLPSLECL